MSQLMLWPLSLLNVFRTVLHVLRAPNHLSTHLSPVDTVVEIFINEPAYRDVVASDDIETVGDFGAWLWVVLRSDDSFNCFIQNNVGELITRKQGADQGAAISSDDEDFL